MTHDAEATGGVSGRVADIQGSEDSVFGSELSRPWLVANVVGFTIAGAVGGGVLRALADATSGTSASVLDGARIAAAGAGLSGAVHGAIVGTAQWLVLRRFVRAAWWIPATLIPWTVSGVVVGFGGTGLGSTNGPIPAFFAILLVPPSFVLLHGAGQWLILRGHAVQAEWWPVFHAGSLIAAWMLGLTVAAMFPLVAGNQYPSVRGLTVVGLVAGCLYGWLTGLFLAELRRHAARTAQRSA